MEQPLREHYTFADIMEWDERAEIIEGELTMMSAPSREHQKILMEISRQIANFLEGKTCEVYPAPFDVRLFETAENSPNDVDTVLEPDISVICDRNKLDEHGCKGAPDLVVEILSRGTLSRDRIVKHSLYSRAGVREYWIVDPLNRSVEVFLPDNRGVLTIDKLYTDEDIVRVNVLSGCFVELNKVFK